MVFFGSVFTQPKKKKNPSDLFNSLYNFFIWLILADTIACVVSNHGLHWGQRLHESWDDSVP